MTQTSPGIVTYAMGNQSGVTIVDMDNPAREGASGSSTPPPRAKRKYVRRHLDKQLHEEHSDKELDSDG